jgi:hypothetical protein
MTDDYSRILYKDTDTMPRTAVTGIAPSLLPNRISKFYDLHGPSVHIDTACSSSMVAFDMACQSVAIGDATAVRDFLITSVTGFFFIISSKKRAKITNYNFNGIAS